MSSVEIQKKKKSQRPVPYTDILREMVREGFKKHGIIPYEETPETSQMSEKKNKKVSTATTATIPKPEDASPKEKKAKATGSVAPSAPVEPEFVKPLLPKKPVSSATKRKAEEEPADIPKKARKTMGNVSDKQVPSTSSQAKKQQSSPAPKLPPTMAVSPRQSSKVDKAGSGQEKSKKSANPVGKKSTAVTPPARPSTQTSGAKDVKKSTVAPNQKSKPKIKLPAVRNVDEKTKKVARPAVKEQRQLTEKDDTLEEPVIVKPQKIVKKQTAPVKKKEPAGKIRAAVDEQSLALPLPPRILPVPGPGLWVSQADLDSLKLGINKTLDDFFTGLRERASEPQGFVTFQGLRNLLINQNIISAERTTKDVMDLAKAGGNQ